MAAGQMNGASQAAKFFVGLACAIIVLLEIWSGWREHTVALEESSRATSNMALALAQHADQTFNEVDVVLLGMLEHLDKDGGGEAGLQRTHDFLVMHVSRLPQLSGLFVYDEKGRWIVNSQPALESRYNNADRDYFLYHRDHRTDRAYIGNPVRSKSNGQWILTISRRVNHPDGSFAGVVLGTIDLAYLARFYEQFDIGRNGAIMFASLQGTVFQRRPLLPDSIGKSLSTSPLFQLHVKQSQTGSVEVRSTQDGVNRINSYQHLHDYPLFIIVAMSKDEILADWTKHAWGRGLGVALLLLVLSYGGTRMVRQVSLRERAESAAVDARLHVEELYQTLEAQAQRDGLTEVFNRRYFDNALEGEVARLRRSGGMLSLVMIDVDHFKLFNDTYGHVAGDACLKEVAATISSVVQRHCDVLARYGGEEFAVILPECGKHGAQAVARMLLQSIRNRAIPHQASAGGVLSLSAGIVSVSDGQGTNVTAHALVQAADQALYQAKHNGRDQAVYRDYPEQLAKPQDSCVVL